MNRHASRFPSAQMGTNRYSANIAAHAATVWLFKVVTKVVRKVPKHADAITNTRPQSETPRRSTRRLKRNSEITRGSQLVVNRIVRTTSHGSSFSVQPNLC